MLWGNRCFSIKDGLGPRGPGSVSGFSTAGAPFTLAHAPLELKCGSDEENVGRDVEGQSDLRPETVLSE